MGAIFWIIRFGVSKDISKEAQYNMPRDYFAFVTLKFNYVNEEKVDV